MDPARWVSLPGCDVVLPPPGESSLRLSVAGSGWFLDADGKQRQVLCGDYDALVASLLRTPPKRYFGLMVSSVLPGLCLGPVLSLAVESVVMRQLRGKDAGTLVHSGERVAIASRSHALRDYLAESTLRFGRETFPFMTFPTFRLNRNGEEQPARFGRDGNRRGLKQFTESPRFLFYDLSPLNATNDIPPCALVLAEIAEADGPQYVDRLIKFAGACKARFVIPIISYHDVEKRRLLQALDFTLVTVTKAKGLAEPDFTFSALAGATPTRTAFGVTSCAEPIETALAVDRAYRTLRDMWKICGDAQPRQLRRAWNLLDEMTTSPASIATLETIRRDAPGVTTIGFGLGKLPYLDCSALPSQLQTALNLRWPHLCEALKEIYEMLRSRNPIAERVMERILDAREPLMVMTRNDLSAAALRRELVFEWEWKDDGSVRIGAAATFARERVVARNLLAVGFNPSSRPQLHWSALPINFDVVTFPHLLTALAEYQELVRRNGEVLLPKSNEVLASVRDTSDVRETRAPAFQIVYSDLGQEIAAFASARRAAAALPKEQPEDLIAEDEMALAEMTTTQAERESGSALSGPGVYEEAEGPYVVIRLVGGEEHRADVNTVFAVLPAESEEMVKLKAIELSQGDRVVLLSEDEHRSVYALIAERTQHLFPIDDRTLDLWESVTDVLRIEYPPERPSAVEAFCVRLEGEHCLRGRQTMRNWLSGRVHAPEAREDIEILLRVASIPGKIDNLSGVVWNELEHYRNFRRTIGRAIVRRTAQRAEGRTVRSRVDEEVDEVLELCDVRVVESVDVIDASVQ